MCLAVNATTDHPAPVWPVMMISFFVLSICALLLVENMCVLLCCLCLPGPLPILVRKLLEKRDV